MRVVRLARGAGKTDALLQWMRSAPPGEHRVGVFPTPRRAMDVLAESRASPGNTLESWQFVTFGELFGARVFSGVLRGRGGEVVLGIDDLDLALASALRFRVDLVTVTEDRRGSR